MAASNAGQRLSDADAQRYVDHLNAGIPQPDEFDNVVFDNTTGGAIYRYRTEAERKSASDAAAATAKAQADGAARVDRVRADAMKRGVAVPAVPEPPVVPLVGDVKKVSTP